MAVRASTAAKIASREKTGRSGTSRSLGDDVHADDELPGAVAGRANVEPDRYDRLVAPAQRRGDRAPRPALQVQRDDRRAARGDGPGDRADGHRRERADPTAHRTAKAQRDRAAA